MNKIICGDSLIELAKLPAGIVQTCVTSPPYYGLRDYGTASWEGGAADCDHAGKPFATKANINANTGGGNDVKNKENREFYKSVCGKCGAVRVDNQIGLEPTPEEFISRLVAVFREVKRVLRPDGTLFVNMGDSYSSQSRPYSNKYAIIREDLTPEETYEAALGIRRYMPELWRNCWGEAGEGLVPEMLPEEVQRGTSRENAGISAKELSQRPQEFFRSNIGKVEAEKSGSDSADGRKVRLLRRDRTNFPLFRSYQGRGAKGLRKGWWSARGLEAGNSGRITEGQISPSLLELQLGIRYVRLLSSLKLDICDIPQPIKIYFQEVTGLKSKDLIGIPWMLAFALRADGWYLRSDIIWHKPNPMPESVTDRPTKSHEHIFLLSKSPQYYYDADAIREPALYGEEHANKTTSWGTNRKHPNKANVAAYQYKGDNHTTSKMSDGSYGRNKRDVWTVSTKPYSGAHFATFPRDLIVPCILAGSKPGDIVLDPFGGAGTTAKTAQELGREYITIELNQKYVDTIIKPRLLATNVPLFAG